MSSRLHNKWHRHNHHTAPTADINLPDSGHDPIASHDSPFQGDFVLNGALSASGSAQLAGDTALTLRSNNLSLSATGNATIDGVTTVSNVVVKTLLRFDPVTYPSRTFGSEVTHTGTYLEVNIDNQSYYIPLWKAS
jgi:hypothetical protein